MNSLFKARLKQSGLTVTLSFLVVALCIGVYRGGVHLVTLEAGDITISELPSALMLSFLRMSISYLASLVFAFILGLFAARTAWGERIIIPLLDILQSVPVVGFFPAAISFFIALTDGHRLGIEMAAIFLIFTSQAWNIAFAVYEAIKGIPNGNLDAVAGFGVPPSQRLWKLYIPVTIPRVVYNSILSWSNGWFFLVACEIIAVGSVRYHLPGIGSFLARAAEQNEIVLVLWGLGALTALILLLDFLIWQPASVWAQRFRQEHSGAADDDEIAPRLVSLPKTVIQRLADFQRPILEALSVLAKPFAWIFFAIPYLIFEAVLPWFDLIWNWIHRKIQWLFPLLFYGSLTGGVLLLGYFLGAQLSPPWPSILVEIPFAILLSTARLIIALSISLAWIIPVVLLVWNRPRLRKRLNTLAQIGASLPAIALFPLIIVTIAQKFGGGMELASILLLLTGMQWYLLFNCLGGVSTIPSDLQEATRSLGLSRVQIWRKLVIPAIRPAIVTGALTAWGGGWNALVVAEYLNFRGEILQVKGIGSLLNSAVYQSGDTRAMTFCIGAMVLWIIFINILVWRPIYRFAIERYRFES